jgi:hypothetical protein
MDDTSALDVVIGASSSGMAMVMERPVALSLFCKSYATVSLGATNSALRRRLPENGALAVFLKG